MRTNIDAWTESVQPWMVEKRRHIHQYPELSGEEYQTAAYIRETLDALQIPYRVAGTGTIAEIAGAGNAPRIAFRADIDALPMQEATGLPFASVNDGVMHACGHDAHTAMLLGTAKILKENEQMLPGPVRLIFQPAEEKGGGSAQMIAAGCLEDVDSIYCLHVKGGEKTGQFSTKAGYIHASSDAFRIVVHGSSSHGSAPHQGVDAIVIASHIVLALQELISRETPSYEQAVLSICSFHAGSAHNILANHVEMKGTLRTANEEIRTMLHKRIPEIIDGMAKMYRGSAEFGFFQSYASNYNHPALTERIVDLLQRNFGTESVALLPLPSMEGEDFGVYERVVPGVKAYIGTGCPEKIHTVQFALDESMLQQGAAFFCTIAMQDRYPVES